MAEKINGFKTEDGTLFSVLKAAEQYEEDQENSEAFLKEIFLRQMSGLPKYGKYVNASSSSFRRNIGNAGALDVLADLSINYPTQYITSSRKEK